MTDRELLERAAKAAGRRIHWSGNVAVLDDFRPGQDECSAWNTLENDGDALRLAVKLNLDIRFDVMPDGAFVSVGAWWGDDDDGVWCNEFLHKDASAATRRAITRAAAEMAPS